MYHTLVGTKLPTHLSTHTLIDKLLVKLFRFHPQCCRELDDMRVDRYVLSISPSHYLLLQGDCGMCDRVSLYNKTNISQDITTRTGLQEFVDDEEYEDGALLLFEVDVKTFHGNIYDFVVYVTTSVENKLTIDI
jgi:hypothetical protein